MLFQGLLRGRKTRIPAAAVVVKKAGGLISGKLSVTQVAPEKKFNLNIIIGKKTT